MKSRHTTFIFHYHVANQCQLHGFTSIHKYSPMASCDSKVSIECTLQNLINHPSTCMHTHEYFVTYRFSPTI